MGSSLYITSRWFHEMILSSELVEFYSKKVKEVKLAKKVSRNL